MCGATIASGTRPFFARAREDTLRADWRAFRDRFIRDDGRVVDTGNAGVSHTEGQGWGLLFAVYFDEPAVFDRMLRWTSDTLRRPHDSLHAWRYHPSDSKHVPDINNATDGDLFIAWALARAARRWGAPDHAHAAADIAHDVLRLLTVQLGGELLLLPGADGFANATRIVVNPSYYVFPALAELAQLVPSASWAELQRTGLALSNRGRFGQWMLPPDWLQIGRADGGLAPAHGWPPLCSYDAIRIPLYLAWSGLSSPATGAFAAFYELRDALPPPAWVNLETHAEAPYPASPGMLAVARIAAEVTMPSGEAPAFPSVEEAPDYYSAALTLLAQIAWQERPAT